MNPNTELYRELSDKLERLTVEIPPFDPRLNESPFEKDELHDMYIKACREIFEMRRTFPSPDDVAIDTDVYLGYCWWELKSELPDDVKLFHELYSRVDKTYRRMFEAVIVWKDMAYPD